jgi:hypothetical protein
MWSWEQRRAARLAGWNRDVNRALGIKRYGFDIQSKTFFKTLIGYQHWPGEHGRIAARCRTWRCWMWTGAPCRRDAPRLREHVRVDIDRANEEVCQRIKQGGRCWWAWDCPGRDPRHARPMILHAGPPVTWERMCGPQRGAVMGALIYEGLARTKPQAPLAASGEVEFSPCHHHHAVGPMAGVVSPRCRSLSSRTRPSATRPTAPRTKAWARCCATAAWGRKCTARLKWMETTFTPPWTGRCRPCRTASTSQPDRPGLHMGDECHNRNRAGTSLFLRAMARPWRAPTRITKPWQR